MEENFNASSLIHLEKYDAIGFDVDHCLIRYKLDEFTHLLYYAYTKSLVEEKNFPRDIFHIDESRLLYNFCMNYLVVDLVIKTFF